MSLTILDPALDDYLTDLQKSDDGILQEMEARAAKENFPIIGPLVGRLCHQMALSIGARDVFEMGSGFGYSTYWFALAVGHQGRVVHTDADRKKSADARNYLSRGGLGGRVQFEIGSALQTLEQYPGPFDIIFIDVDKADYPAAFELAHSRVRVGGYIITDNVLWSGRVVGPAKKSDAETKAIVKYNRSAFTTPDLFTTIVPLRDGVALSLKLPASAKRTVR